MERSLRRDDPSIKEATIDTSSLPSSDDLFITPPMSEPSTEESQEDSTPPSMSDVNVTPKEISLREIEPSLPDTSEEERGSSAETSSEMVRREHAGSWEPNEGEAYNIRIAETIGNANDNSEEREQSNSGTNYVAVVNPDQRRHNDTPIVFDVANAMVANGSLAGDVPNNNVPDIPEHVLIVIQDDNVITHLINFSNRHTPEEILEAFWTNSLNMSLPDEGIENTAEITPTAPPPTPSSSTEAIHSSPNGPELTSESIPEVTIDSSSDMSVIYIEDRVNDELDSKGEDANEEEETEDGERGI